MSAGGTGGVETSESPDGIVWESGHLRRRNGSNELVLPVNEFGMSDHDARYENENDPKGDSQVVVFMSPTW